MFILEHSWLVLCLPLLIHVCIAVSIGSTACTYKLYLQCVYCVQRCESVWWCVRLYRDGQLDDVPPDMVTLVESSLAFVSRGAGLLVLLQPLGHRLAPRDTTRFELRTSRTHTSSPTNSCYTVCGIYLCKMTTAGNTRRKQGEPYLAGGVDFIAALCDITGGEFL